MDYELNKASRRLSELPFTIELSGFTVEVKWLRIMQKTGKWLIPRHAHSSFEFHIIARGTCRVATDENSFFAREGSFYLTAPGIYHEQSNYDEDDLIEYSLDCTFHPKRESAAQEESEWNQLHSFFLNAPCLPFKDTSGLIRLFDQAIEEALHLRPAYGITILSLVPSMLVAAARSMGMGPTLSNNNQKTRMDRIAEFVEDNIHRNLSPADIAAYLNLSEKQVSRIVFASEGYSTKRFIILAKLEQAKNMLSNPSYSINEIAEELGYSTTSYFTTVFRKNEGVTPGAYREKVLAKLTSYHT
ncbi:MAG: helix-turn-helix domain-containing protein [Sphaerochaeta sp.]|uniref:helix-turn-helix domain-containing protein n=1 Tax=Sphaerochaeta sp. TaxID=1972642 RepID=UPI003D12AB81